MTTRSSPHEVTVSGESWVHGTPCRWCVCLPSQGSSKSDQSGCDAPNPELTSPWQQQELHVNVTRTPHTATVRIPWTWCGARSLSTFTHKLRGCSADRFSACLAYFFSHNIIYFTSRILFILPAKHPLYFSLSLFLFLVWAGGWKIHRLESTWTRGRIDPISDSHVYVTCSVLDTITIKY